MSYWKTELNEGVVTAAYTNAPMNYFCAEGTQELWNLIDEWQDPSVRAVILTGGVDGKFITHYSVEELLDLAKDREAMRLAGTSLTSNYHSLLKNLSNLPKPIIVAMNGDTMGGGFELSLSCDLRIGQNGDYRYGFPEVKLGILPGGSGTQRLSRLIGVGRALEFVIRSRVVPPEEALRFGLIHEVADSAIERATDIAHEIANFPPIAVARAKHAVHAGNDTHLEAGLDIESSAFLETMLSDDGVLAMQTYVDLPYEKRRDWLDSPTNPGYTGK